MVNTIKRDIEDEIEDEWLGDESVFDFEDAEQAAAAKSDTPADETQASESGEEADAPPAGDDREEPVAAKSGSGD